MSRITSVDIARFDERVAKNESHGSKGYKGGPTYTYANGYKYCRICTVFLKTEDKYHSVCGKMLRLRPKSKTRGHSI